MKNSVNKKLVITGGTGYIGSQLIRDLSTQYDVFVLTRNNSHANTTNVIFHKFESAADIEILFKTHQIDSVIHLASKTEYNSSIESIPEFINSNITFGSILLEIMTKNGCKKLINASTFWQEFSSSEKLPICFYAATKSAFEKIIDYYTLDQKLSAISLKLFDVYGPRDPRPKVFQQVKLNWTQDVETKLSSGEQLIYFTHINDVVSGIQTILNTNTFTAGQHLHFDLRGFAHSLKSAVTIFCETQKILPQLGWGKSYGRKNQIFNPVLGELIPNWKPKIDIYEGFKDI